MFGMTPVFFIGNKRSGTHRLVTLLCLHPDMFVSLESDVMWILYQARNGKPSEYKQHPLDGTLAMRTTLELCPDILDELYAGDITSWQAFYKIQLVHMRRYRKNNVQIGEGKEYPLFIGDKKPAQNSDKILNSFIESILPTSKYIHLVRNPLPCVASMQIAGKTWPTHTTAAYWRESPEKTLEQWTINEKNALEIESKKPDDVYRIRLEDLCDKPIESMRDLLEFFGLQVSTEMAATIKTWVDPNPNKKHADFKIDIPDETRQVMKEYGYV